MIFSYSSDEFKDKLTESICVMLSHKNISIITPNCNGMACNLKVDMFQFLKPRAVKEIFNNVSTHVRTKSLAMSHNSNRTDNTCFDYVGTRFMYCLYKYKIKTRRDVLSASGSASN